MQNAPQTHQCPSIPQLVPIWRPQDGLKCLIKFSTMSTTQDLGRLDLNSVDVTDAFWSTTEQIKFGDVVKCSDFKLFTGTHALETMNPKLDTALIKILPFDFTQVTTIDQVDPIIAGLYRSLCAWLDNNSLSVSFLSCAYIERLLVQYTKQGNRNISFHTSDASVTYTDLSQLQSVPESVVVVDLVLRNFCMALIQFAKFVLRLGFAGVVYEEEDINTQTMDLDLLTAVDPQETLKELNLAIDWLMSKGDSYKQSADYLTLMSYLLQIPDLLQISVNPFSKDPVKLESVDTMITDALKLVDSLKSATPAEPPVNCFSANVQKRLNNRSPPKAIALMSYDDTMNNIHKLFADLQWSLHATDTHNCVELTQFLLYTMNRRAATTGDDEIVGLHIVVRAWFQLFFIRDDESIMGCSTYSMGDFLYELITSISFQDAKILSSPDGSSERNRLQELISEIKVPFYNFLTCVSQNPARQRQFVSRDVLFWDRLQAEVEKFETDANVKYPDNFQDNSSFPILPLSSFIYFVKLVKMVEFMMKSVELNLERDLRELNVGYWLTSYLIDYLLQHTNRLIDVSKHRQLELSQLPAKIKKAKGDKQQRLKQEYEIRKKHADSYVATEKFLRFLMTKYSIYHNMVEVKLVTLQLANYYGHLKLPKLCKAPERLLFGLQLKSLQAIGTPQLPSFDDYIGSMDKFNGTFTEIVSNNDFQYFRKLLQTKSVQLKSLFKESRAKLEALGFEKFLTDEIGNDLSKLQRSSLYGEISLSKLVKLVENGKGDQLEFSVERAGQHLYFPNITGRVSTSSK